MSDPSYEAQRIQRLNEILFSTNIGFAVAYALFAYDGCSRTAVNAPKGVRDLLAGFSQILRRIAPLGVHMRTKVQLLRSTVIDEVVFLALLSTIAFLMYLLARLLGRSERGRRVFVSVSGFAALAAVPVCWLYVVSATWFDYEPRTFGGTYGYLSIAEIAVAGGLMYLLRNQPIWRGSIVLALHYFFWIAAIGARNNGNFIAPVIVSLPFSLVFPGACFAWLQYARSTRTQEAILA